MLKEPGEFNHIKGEPGKDHEFAANEKNPENNFASVDKPAFAPAHVVDGISLFAGVSGRIRSYSDAHRYGLGGMVGGEW